MSENNIIIGKCINNSGVRYYERHLTIGKFYVVQNTEDQTIVKVTLDNGTTERVFRRRFIIIEGKAAKLLYTK